MRILIIGNGSDFPLLEALSRERGNEIFYCDYYKCRGRGMTSPELNDQKYEDGILSENIREVDNFWDFLDQVDFILVSFPGIGKDVDLLRGLGYGVLGAGQELEKLNDDSESIKVACMKLDVPYLGSNDAYDNIDCSIGAFYNGSRFVRPYCVHFANTRLMDGEIGPITPELMGVSLYYTYQDIPITKLLDSVAERLLGDQFKGMFRVNCSLTPEGDLLIKNFDTRIGGITFATQLLLHEEPLSTILSGIVNGGMNRFSSLSDTWAIGVSVNAPGYPYPSIFRKNASIKVSGVKDALEDNCQLSPIGMFNDGEYFTKPGVGEIMFLFGIGDSIEKARFAAYKTLDYISYPDAMYRLDIGLRVFRHLGRLMKLGIIPRNILGV